MRRSASSHARFRVNWLFLEERRSRARICLWTGFSHWSGPRSKKFQSLCRTDLNPLVQALEKCMTPQSITLVRETARLGVQVAMAGIYNGCGIINHIWGQWSGRWVISSIICNQIFIFVIVVRQGGFIWWPCRDWWRCDVQWSVNYYLIGTGTRGENFENVLCCKGVSGSCLGADQNAQTIHSSTKMPVRLVAGTGRTWANGYFHCLTIILQYWTFYSLINLIFWALWTFLGVCCYNSLFITILNLCHSTWNDCHWLFVWLHFAFSTYLWSTIIYFRHL